MDANRRAGGGVSPELKPGMGPRALKAGVHRGDAEGTENGIG